MAADFRERLLARERLIGTVLTLRSPEIAELLSLCGFDWLFIDAEHNPLGPLDCQRFIQAVAERCACIVRVPVANEPEIKKMLDIGADGILAPQINNADEAQRVVEWCKYPPMGQRGVGLARAQGYGMRFKEYMSSANERVAVIVQAEHIDAVSNIDSIVSIEGIDAVLIGPYDLSANMGKAGEVDDPEVVHAIETVTRACQQAGVKLGIFGATAEAVIPYIEKGYTLIVTGTDTIFLSTAASNTLEQLRSPNRHT